MDYPSATQALFALVVMIIVLLFILVYCCSGAFPCNAENNATTPDPTARRIQNPLGSSPSRTSGSGSSEDNDNDPLGQRTVVIVPMNGMIYYREQNSDRIFQIPTRGKPPAYTDLFNPPPPYSIRTVTPSPTNDYVHPPAYEESFRDWKLTLDNDNWFDGHLSALPSSRASPLSQTINDLINEATLTIAARAQRRICDDANINVFSPAANVVPNESHTTLNLDPSNMTSTSSRLSPRTNSPQQQIEPFSDPSVRRPPDVSNQGTSNDESIVQSGIRRNNSSELILRVPGSDVFSLIRDVTVAETSRRDAEMDPNRRRQDPEDPQK